MVRLRLALVSIAAVLMVGCGSQAATPTTDLNKNLDKKIDAAPKPGGGAGPQIGAMTVQPGPGAAEADKRVGSKSK